MNQVELDVDKIKVNENKPEVADGEKNDEVDMMPWDKEGCKERMVTINQAVKDVSDRI